MIWPLKALCDYLEHTNDPTILQQRVPYTDDETFLPSDKVETILEHVDRMIDRMRQQALPTGSPYHATAKETGTIRFNQQTPFSVNEWSSSWTTELMYQTLQRYLASHSRGLTSRNVPQRSVKLLKT